MVPHKYLTDLNGDERKKTGFGIWWIQKMGFFQISMFFYQNFRFGGLVLGLIELIDEKAEPK